MTSYRTPCWSLVHQRKYVIGSGWFSEPGLNRRPEHGCSYLRTVEFHKIWLDVLLRYSNPCAVIIGDSASPIPLPPDSREQVIRMDANYHALMPDGLSGWMRSFLLGAMFAHCCESDFIYVEQDCLAVGDWVDAIYAQAEKAPDSMLLGVPAVTADGITKQVVQMSVVFVPYALLLDLPKALGEIDPDIGRDEYQLQSTSLPRYRLPFGVGRARPIPVEAPAFEVQHMTKEELCQVAARIGPDIHARVVYDLSHPETWTR